MEISALLSTLALCVHVETAASSAAWEAGFEPAVNEEQENRREVMRKEIAFMLQNNRDLGVTLLHDSLRKMLEMTGEQILDAEADCKSKLAFLFPNK